MKINMTMIKARTIIAPTIAIKMIAHNGNEELDRVYMGVV
jgi:hypothetical protein